MIINTGDFATWARVDLTTITEDELATLMMQAASDKVRTVAGHPEWTLTDVPIRARQIATHLAVRSYLNPESVERDGNLGPLGGDTRVRELSIALHLTEAEEAELRDLNVAAVAASQSALWIQPLRMSVPTGDGDILLGSLAYGHEDDSYAFTEA